MLVDIDPESGGRSLRFVLAPGATPASSAYASLLPEEGERTEICPEGLVVVKELSSRVRESGGAALIADYGEEGIGEHTLRVSELHVRVAYS